MSWIMTEYWCEMCRERWESLEQRPAPSHILHERCSRLSDRVISAGHFKTVWGWVQRGKNSKDEKPPRALDTEALADGMKVNEFRERRKKERAEWRRQRIRKMVS